MLPALSDRPDFGELETFLRRVLDERGDDLEFVVLFGSMARGDWSRGSDYDVLIGLRKDDGKRFIDRIGDFQALTRANIDVLPYARSEWQRLVDQRSLLMLEALDHGIPLWDRGAFADLQRAFQRWRTDGEVTPLPHGWQIHPRPERGQLTS